ncbi:MAG: radical SAM protein, partial [Pseudomonadota bacterium]
MAVKKLKNLSTIWRSIYHYKKGSIILPYMPNALWIEPTNVCNLKCIMCPNSIVKNQNPGYMDMGVYTKIIDEAKYFASYVTLCLSGESLLHKSFPDMVAYAKTHDLSVYLSTNATVMTPEISRKIITAGLDWINFSFDGVTKETYEKIRVNACFEKTLGYIIEFLKIKKELCSRTIAEIQIIVIDKKGQLEYEANREKFCANFDGLPLDSIQLRTPSTWGGYFLNTDKYEPKKNAPIRFSPCSYLWSSLHVLWDGTIVACTSDFFGTNILGKFPDKSLKQIWNDAPMQQFRKAMLQKVYLSYNKNCEACDALWEPAIAGLP